MTPPAPFRQWHEHYAVDLQGSTAVFTTRRGGTSAGPFSSLNLGRLTDDEPAAVEHNRATLEHQVARQLTYVRQVHGAKVVRAQGTVAPADGQVVGETGLAPLVLTADCLPIAVAGSGGAAILHAGWRGLAAGVIRSGLARLREMTRDRPLEAAIGPGAGPCCYEVGEEVHERFATLGPVARRGSNLDLKAIARRLLQAEGVSKVHDIGLCTICGDRSLFFSHRRDRGVTGRQAGVVWLS